jgi:hypothetical protein
MDLLKSFFFELKKSGKIMPISILDYTRIGELLRISPQHYMRISAILIIHDLKKMSSESEKI